MGFGLTVAAEPNRRPDRQGTDPLGRFDSTGAKMPARDASLVTRALGRIGRLSTRARDRVGGLRVRASERRRGVPVPPGNLIFTVANTENLEWFLSAGKAAAGCVESILAANGVEFSTLGSVLDFGCGIGRVIRHWADVNGPEFHGTDYNPSLVAWCRDHLPFATFGINALDARLDYAAAKFDLAYAFSVFTHLNGRLQTFWMDELFRVLKPGGYAIITTHGQHYVDQLDDHERAEFLAGNGVVRVPRREGSNHCASFHPEQAVRDTLAARFQVVDFVSEGALGNPRQDLYLLRKPIAQTA